MELESRCSRSQIAWICCCSSSNITTWVPPIRAISCPATLAILDHGAVGNALIRTILVIRFYQGIQPSPTPLACRLNLSPVGERARNGDAVGVFQLAADGEARGDAGHLDAEGLTHLG